MAIVAAVGVFGAYSHYRGCPEFPSNVVAALYHTVTLPAWIELGAGFDVDKWDVKPVVGRALVHGAGGPRVAGLALVAAAGAFPQFRRIEQYGAGHTPKVRRVGWPTT